jgi:hypothetical protein
MNDRVVASLRSGGVQLELMALVWKRTSLSVLANGVLPLSTKFLDQSGPSHSISSGLAFAVAVVACIACRPRGQRLQPPTPQPDHRQKPCQLWICLDPTDHITSERRENTCLL